jgi:predicted GNAT superfamily acetyltransferase
VTRMLLALDTRGQQHGRLVSKEKLELTLDQEHGRINLLICELESQMQNCASIPESRCAHFRAPPKVVWSLSRQGHSTERVRSQSARGEIHHVDVALEHR